MFGQCKSYPHISTQSEITPVTTDEQSKPAVKQKVERPKQSVKRKTTSQKPPAKKAKTQSAKKPSPKTQTKQSRKQAVCKPQFKKSPPRESSEEEHFDSEEDPFDSEEDPLNSDEDPFFSEEEEFFSEDEPGHLTPYELNLFAKQSRNGFGPRLVYD